jgi:hypothetical protein
MPRSLCIVLFSLLLILPAGAQNKAPIDEKQCADQFKTADINNDGVLTTDEIGTFKQTLPTSLANKERVSRADFMAVCGKKAS